MVVGSTFSGVGGFDLGLHRAGHAVAFQVESDPYRRAVLARHWPDVPRYDDVCTFDGAEWRGRIGMLAGGFPCQDLSVAGQRAGLAGAKSGLFYEFARIADRAIEPGGFVLVENVAGLLSSHRGRDFAIVLATLAELGFCDLAWRVVDSQYFGVPQRRRRVFILGRRGVGRRCATILLEPEGGGGDFEARRKKTPRVAHRTENGIARTRTGSGKRYDADTDDFVIAPTLKANGSHGTGGAGGRNDEHPIVAVADTLKSPKGGGRTNDASANYWVEDFRNGTLTADPGRTDRKPIILGSPAHANGMRTPSSVPGRLDDPAVSVTAINMRGRAEGNVPELSDLASVRAASGGSTRSLVQVRARAGVVGSPDDPKPDGRRYAAVGDAVTVNVAAWIGYRLADFERGDL
jgi:DNA-cytosine methyltransferase